jgi:hypothetical protein
MPTAADWANLSFLPYKQRNAALDRLFYDTGSLTADELAKLSPLADKEGSIIVVPPSSSGQPIRHYKKALRFMNKEGDDIRAIAVAGVGSSVVGTAALARNVADAFGYDVAGIVTGYGLTDLLAEAWGGWFVFGAADRARLSLERLLAQLATTMPEAPFTKSAKSAAFASDFAMNGFEGSPGAADVTTLVDILMARPKKLELLVGHSKGSLMIDYVLKDFVRELEDDDHPLYKALTIVTFGAVASLPDKFKNVHQFVGEMDWFGKLNSSPGVPYDEVPGAWHHLNRSSPYHLDAVAALQSLQ